MRFLLRDASANQLNSQQYAYLFQIFRRISIDLFNRIYGLLHARHQYRQEDEDEQNQQEYNQTNEVLLQPLRLQRALHNLLRKLLKVGSI